MIYLLKFKDRTEFKWSSDIIFFKIQIFLQVSSGRRFIYVYIHTCFEKMHTDYHTHRAQTYFDDDARRFVPEHHTIVGFVCGLPPGAGPSHKLLL